MEKPIAPKGWRVSNFDYNGESPVEYNNDVIVFGLERTIKNIHQKVFLEAKPSLIPTKDNYFDVCRIWNYTDEYLGPIITSAKQGIDYCIMVAERYMDIPADEIPGAGEGGEERQLEFMKEVFKVCAKTGTKVNIISP